MGSKLVMGVSPFGWEYFGGLINQKCIVAYLSNCLEGYNSRAKSAAEMSLGLQNSTSISTFEYRHISDLSDNSPSSDTETKRLQEMQDLRAMSQREMPEKDHKVEVDHTDKPPESENSRVESTTRYENPPLTEVSEKEIEELPSATPIVECNAADFCSVPEMMVLFNDPGLSFSDIEPVVPLTGWKSVKRLIFGPPKLNRSLLKERDSIFALAKMPLDNSSELHKSILQTVFLKLVG